MIRAEYEIGGEAVVQSWLLWRVAAVGSYKGTPTPKLGLATVLGNIRTVHIPEVHGSSTLYSIEKRGPLSDMVRDVIFGDILGVNLEKDPLLSSDGNKACPL